MLALPNLISFVFLLVAVFFARKGRIKAHKFMVCMTMLVSFVLVYLFAEMRLQGGALISPERMAVFSLGFKLFLFSHIFAATLTFLLSLVVVGFGLKEPGKKWHKRLAYTLVPIWAYSAITGVAVYAIAGSPDDPVEISEFHESIQGKWSLLTFGYTHCPDVCPMTLSQMQNIYLELNGRVQVLFVTADPKRDTKDHLEKYLSHFNPEFKGLRSENGAEHRLAKQLGTKIVLEEEDPKNPGRYSVFHPSGFYLINPKGMLKAHYSYPVNLNELILDVNEKVPLAQSPLAINNVWVAEALPGVNVTAAYLNLENISENSIEITSVSSPAFDEIMIHNTVEIEGISKMMHLDSLSLSAGMSVEFAPGGYHLMLFGPKKMIQINDLIHFELHTDSNKTIRFEGRVRARGDQ